MKFPVYTATEAMIIRLCFGIKNAQADDDALFIRLFDPEKKKANYHHRRVPVVNGENCVNLKTPFSPGKMIADIKRKHGRFDYKLQDISFEPLMHMKGSDAEWTDMAEYISGNCSDLKTGTYFTDYKKVKFILADEIKNDDGTTSKTPARVFHDNGDTMINLPEFIKNSVYTRMFILKHERGHYLKGTLNENEADRYAAENLLAAGYPKLEIVYAATKIFPDTPETRERANKLLSYIQNHAA